ncbi:flagellar hook-length control protein FliK [Mesorhizobium sp. LHD-90]|uniref:flagellar hook-length control protein FliK n=1 Tax=Mesorhizobium sp. LHD-90 TaxID=3071414 RepID=UPI0027E14C43|nr:flagellar hook-length control protein FliK [Mesorhizobium sp. LHD-90]MDQ6433722.1 flagellar hook-length control protein FliK [Mesorhizobium sp. LHD-90]
MKTSNIAPASPLAKPTRHGGPARRDDAGAFSHFVRQTEAQAKSSSANAEGAAVAAHATSAGDKSPPHAEELKTPIAADPESTGQPHPLPAAAASGRYKADVAERETDAGDEDRRQDPHAADVPVSVPPAPALTAPVPPSLAPLPAQSAPLGSATVESARAASPDAVADAAESTSLPGAPLPASDGALKAPANQGKTVAPDVRHAVPDKADRHARAAAIGSATTSGDDASSTRPVSDRPSIPAASTSPGPAEASASAAPPGSAVAAIGRGLPPAVRSRSEATDARASVRTPTEGETPLSRDAGTPRRQVGAAPAGDNPSTTAKPAPAGPGTPTSTTAQPQGNQAQVPSAIVISDVDLSDGRPDFTPRSAKVQGPGPAIGRTSEPSQPSRTVAPGDGDRSFSSELTAAVARYATRRPAAETATRQPVQQHDTLSGAAASIPQPPRPSAAGPERSRTLVASVLWTKHSSAAGPSPGADQLQDGAGPLELAAAPADGTGVHPDEPADEHIAQPDASAKTEPALQLLAAAATARPAVPPAQQPSPALALTAAILTEPTWRPAPVAVATHPSSLLAPLAPRTLELQLNPEHLGALTATLSISGTQLKVEIRVATREAHDRLKGEEQVIEKAIRSLGYEVGQVTVIQSLIASNASARADAATPPGLPQGRDQPPGGTPGDGGERSGGHHGGRSEEDGSPVFAGTARRDADRGSGGLYI